MIKKIINKITGEDKTLKREELIRDLTINDFDFNIEKGRFLITKNTFDNKQTILDANKQKMVEFRLNSFTYKNLNYILLDNSDGTYLINYKSFKSFYKQFDDVDAIETTKYYLTARLKDQNIIKELINTFNFKSGFDKYSILINRLHFNDYKNDLERILNHAAICMTDLSPLIEFDDRFLNCSDENTEMSEEYKNKLLNLIKEALIRQEHLIR